MSPTLLLALGLGAFSGPIFQLDLFINDPNAGYQPTGYPQYLQTAPQNYMNVAGISFIQPADLMNDTYDFPAPVATAITNLVAKGVTVQVLVGGEVSNGWPQLAANPQKAAAKAVALMQRYKVGIEVDDEAGGDATGVIAFIHAVAAGKPNGTYISMDAAGTPTTEQRAIINGTIGTLDWVNLMVSTPAYDQGKSVQFAVQDGVPAEKILVAYYAGTWVNNCNTMGSASNTGDTAAGLQIVQQMGIKGMSIWAVGGASYAGCGTTDAPGFSQAMKALNIAQGNMTYDKVDKPTTVNQRSIDELERRLQSMIELKTGWAEPHKLSRELQRMFKIYDIDNTGTMSLDEFEKALVKLNIGGTDAEVEALFDRYDTNENGVLSFAEFTDGLFSVKPCPLADEQCRVVLKRIQDRIITRTGGTTRGLSRSIRIMDKDKSNSLSFEELKTGLERAGVRIDDNEMKVIMKHFDRDNDNKVSVTEFMRGVRGPLSPRRKNLVIAAYYILDKNRDQRITLAEISSVYDVSRHPLVVNGTKTQEEVLKDFISDWDKDGDGVVLLEEWLDYYKDISAGIDNDDYFELMMRNAWHLPGGEGWCANTANLRVLVKHTDGRQTVQTLKSDLGIKPSDTSKIKKQLVAQGKMRQKTVYYNDTTLEDAEVDRKKEGISLKDLVVRVKFSSSVRLVYIGAVGLTALLMFLSAVTEGAHGSGWYLFGEAVLTLLFVGEIVLQMWLSGPLKYFSQSLTNILEFLLCVSCCMIFGLSLSNRFTRMEFEALLLSLRYSAQLARLYFFYKSQYLASTLQRKVQLHKHDNPAITLPNTLEQPSIPSHLWQSDDGADHPLLDVV